MYKVIFSFFDTIDCCYTEEEIYDIYETLKEAKEAAERIYDNYNDSIVNIINLKTNEDILF